MSTNESRVLSQVLRPASSRRNHPYHSNSFDDLRDRRIPSAEPYDRGTRRRHKREVEYCRMSSSWRAHCEPSDRTKPAGEVDFVRCSAPDPQPAVSLPAAIEGQMNAISLGFCRTDAHEPPFVRSSTEGDANKQRYEGRQKEWTHSTSLALEPYRLSAAHQPAATAGSSSRRLHCPENGRLDSDQGGAGQRRYPDPRNAGDHR